MDVARAVIAPARGGFSCPTHESRQEQLHFYTAAVFCRMELHLDEPTIFRLISQILSCIDEERKAAPPTNRMTDKQG
jgi:hypothetical protein